MHKNYPKYYYFINKLNTEDIKDIKNNFEIIYRNYEQKPNIEDVKKFKIFCKKKKIKFLISNYFDIAIKLNLDGFYIPSFNKKHFNQKQYYSKKFIIIGSAHNFKEIQIKEKQGVNLIFLSPVFKTKKKENFLDIIKFNNLCNFTKKPIIALGGINNKNINKLKMTNIFGIAGISHIKELSL